MPGPLALVGLSALAEFFRRIFTVLFSQFLKQGVHQFIYKLAYIGAIAAAFGIFYAAGNAALNTIPRFLPPHFSQAMGHFIHPQMPTLIASMLTFQAAEWIYDVTIKIAKVKFRG